MCIMHTDYLLQHIVMPPQKEDLETRKSRAEADLTLRPGLLIAKDVDCNLEPPAGRRHHQRSVKGLDLDGQVFGTLG